jgi:hypothetical protein
MAELSFVDDIVGYGFKENINRSSGPLRHRTFIDGSL